MKIFSLLAFLAVFFAAFPSLAEGVQADKSQLLVPPPMLEPANPDGSRCFFISNKAPYSVTGSLVTNYYETASGIPARAHNNFRLKSGEKQDFCTYGPFYEGARLELVLRTLMPIFSCYTVAQGEIIIMGETVNGKSRTWALCQ